MNYLLKFTLIIPVLAGSFLIYSSSRYFVDSIRSIETLQIEDKLLDKKNISLKEKKILFDSIKLRLESIDSPELYYKKSNFERRLAEIEDDRTQKLYWYERAEDSIENSLIRRPSDPYALFRLAYIKYKLSGPNTVSAKALELSYLTGMHEPSLGYERTRLALKLWNILSTNTKKLAKSQIIFAFPYHGTKLINLAKQNHKNLRIITRAMAKDIKQFKTYIRSVNKKPVSVR